MSFSREWLCKASIPGVLISSINSVTPINKSRRQQQKSWLQTFLLLVVSPKLIPQLEANYHSRQHAVKHPDSWRDLIETGVVFSRVNGVLREGDSGPRQGYILDGQTQLQELRLEVLLMLVGYMVIQKSVE